MDELLNYLNRERNRKAGLGGQLYSFVQNLSEEARAQDRVVLAESATEALVLFLVVAKEENVFVPMHIPLSVSTARFDADAFRISRRLQETSRNHHGRNRAEPRPPPHLCVAPYSPAS